MPAAGLPKGLQVGDRIELILMTDDPDPIPAGARGTVRGMMSCHFLGCWQIQVDWDQDVGRSISLIVPPDKFKVIG